MGSGHQVLMWSLPASFVGLYFIVLFRYAMFAGGLYWLAWIFKREKWKKYRIDPKYPAPEFIKNEIIYSAISSVFFAAGGLVLMVAWDRGWTKMYINVADHGWTWMFVSLAILLLVHEVYFYLTHRWLHTKQGFKYHRVHHMSFNPSPFAAFSFHPVEAFIQAVILPVMAFVMPVHVGVLLLFLTIMTVTGVFNHCGYELYPRRWMKGWFGKWIVTATHHQHHHQAVKSNYGLYFTFLDIWLGTNYDPASRFADSPEAARVAREDLRLPEAARDRLRPSDLDTDAGRRLPV